ncbi:MAG TPA: hypothetical protein VE990_13420 [Acidimicrobiales bacterium]|nr:hypothetical protein [Acidimicrobiales bacterium]
MERESTKHGPRVDEQLEHETAGLLHGDPHQSRSRDDLQQEELPEDAGLIAGATREDVPMPSPLSPSEVELRAELARRLATLTWPVERDRIVAALGPDLPEELQSWVRRAPGGRYRTFQELWEAMGGHHEGRGAAAAGA